MDKNSREMLEEVINTQLNSLSALQTGSKEKTAAINEVAVLYRLKIDETKNEMEFDEKHARRAAEWNQSNDMEKERYFKLGIVAAEIMIPLIFYAYWMHRGFKFEQEGTYTSTTFRGLFNRFRPTKK
ncbi:MAG: hypothetical protein FWE04_01515 [Oscillospiraceae bacterium]|nr:hypothetical protein [Oscillospiraceae bacterium]